LFATQVSQASSEIDLAGACTMPTTAIGMIVRFVGETITQGISPSEGQCSITSSSLGTNDIWHCNFPVVLNPGQTIPFGAVFIEPTPGPTPLQGDASLQQGPTAGIHINFVYASGG
jgi:hypothetical protein